MGNVVVAIGEERDPGGRAEGKTEDGGGRGRDGGVGGQGVAWGQVAGVGGGFIGGIS